MSEQGQEKGFRASRPGKFSLRLAGMVVLALGIISLAGAAGVMSGRFFQPDPQKKTAPANEAKTDPFNPVLFAGWPKPDLALVLSGEMHGYLLPCGCSEPQKGGLERRYNFVQSLRTRGWPVAAVDLGDLPQVDGPRRDIPNLQGLLKYVVAMKSLKEMGYSAIGVGEYERRMPLTKILDEYALNEKSPRVVLSNLENKSDFDDEVGNWQIATVPGCPVKIGVTSIQGKELAHRKDLGDETKVKIGNRGPALDKVLKEMGEQKVELRILLYQGKTEEAKLCAQAYPQFQLILCLGDSDEPPSTPAAAVGDTLIVWVGHKGKNIGVVGVYKSPTGNKFDFRYQRVEMGPEWKTPPGQEDSNPVLKLMEQYTATLKKEQFLKKYPQVAHPVQQQFPAAQYVGSLECKRCHADAYEVWKDSKHAHAYQTLVDAKRPSLRQFDGECVVCHVTGFAYKTGFTDEEDPNFKILKDVGCEVCHGPGSEHINEELAKNATPAMRKAINPFKFDPTVGAGQNNQRMLKLNTFCQTCHDLENDVHWSYKFFLDDRWPKIEHHTKKK